MIIYDMNHHIIYIYGYPYVGIWHMYNVHIMYEYAYAYVNFFLLYVLCNNKTHRTKKYVVEDLIM